MNFPRRNLFGFSVGWRDKGAVGSHAVIRSGKTLYKTNCCSRCRNFLHIGIENKKPFLFCPVCEVTIGKPNDKAKG